MPAPVRLGTNLGSSTNFASMMDELVAYESAGVDIAWLGESYGYDAVSALGALAMRTSTMEIGSSVLTVYSRTPALLAMTAAGLDAVSRGRFTLGIGASGPHVVEAWHGMSFQRPVARTRRVIDACRVIWREERYSFPSSEAGTAAATERTPLKLMQHPLRERIPIFVASIGAANVAMTAEVADGWLPVFFWPERAQGVWSAALQGGRAKRPSTLAELEIATSTVVAIDGDHEKARRRYATTIAHYIGGMGPPGENYYFDLTCRYGYADEACAIQAAYRAGDRRAAADFVPEELVDGLSLIGPRDAVAARVEAFRAAGVTTLNVVPMGRDLQERVDQISMIRSILDG
jgi:F420-dependent oxidoreductase-like protein